MSNLISRRDKFRCTMYSNNDSVSINTEVKVRLPRDIRRFAALDRKMVLLIVFAALLLTQASAWAQCPTGISHYWKFNETAQPYRDTVGTNDATCTTCPTATTGRVAGALLFNGSTSSDSVNIADDNTFDWGAADNFSIELWMRKPNACTGPEVMVGRVDGTTMSWSLGIDCTAPHAGQVHFQMQSDVSLDVWNTTVVSDGLWHHVVVTRNSDTTRIYVDGAQEGFGAQTYTTGFASTVPMNVGWINTGTPSYYDGILDELALYNRALTLSEIQSHHTLGTSGFGYCNAAPVLAAIGAKSVNEGANLNFGVSATDPEGSALTLSAVNIPANATFTDSLNGKGSFNFNPNYTQSGVYNVTIIASDGTLADSEVVAITVNNVNQPPVLAAIGPKSVNEGVNLAFNTSATDPDATIPVLTAVGLPVGATYVDSLNGRGRFSWTPTLSQSGVYNVTFIASDGTLADSEVVAITVTNVNQPPVLAAIGPKSVNEGVNLAFNTSATDPDATIPVLTAVGLPTGATYVDSLNGRGRFQLDSVAITIGCLQCDFHCFRRHSR